MTRFILIIIFGILFINHAQGWREYPVASDDITFELNFDRQIAPSLCIGSPKIISKFGTVKYAPGMQGKALLCGQGGAKILYLAKENLNFDQPGSVTLWFKPLKWLEVKNQPRCFIFGTECSKGFFGMQVANGPRKLNACYRKLQLRILYSKKIKNKALEVDGIGRKGLNKWHLICISWSQNRLYLSLDGKPYSTCRLNNLISTKALPSKVFSVGSNSHWNYLLDNLRIYSRTLTDKEVEYIWIKENKKLKGEVTK